MPLQYRDDIDRLLYVTDTGASDGKLARECCCDTCTDSVACHRYDACCDAAFFTELPDYPHYIVISDSKYTALGDPATLVYNGCCYGTHDSTTTKNYNVADSDVTADTSFSSCDSCNNIHEDSCVVCNSCNGCVPRLSRIYTATYDVVAKNVDSKTPAEMIRYQEAWDTPWVLTSNPSPSLPCSWSWLDYDTEFFTAFNSLDVGTTTTQISNEVTNAFEQVTFDTCDPTGAYDYPDTIYFDTGASCVVS